ncbi:hypothetical protein A6A25_23365 [Saccharothrix sp. CB00851]|nr:hypothetical protein A6A25_23365 [Saccharothrix sp. CB00851]
MPVDGGGAPTLFAKVPGAAVTPHDTANLIKDAGFTDAPGKESIGGLALSEDGATLYAVNLLTRSLVSFDATGATASTPGATVPIPDPGCAAPTDWRPFSVAAHDSTLYVGGVCSAESTQDRADLEVVVHTYDGTRFTTVLTQPLTAERGEVLAGRNVPGQTNGWNPWNTSPASWDRHEVTPDGAALIDPQPQLASMAFARDGSMILGFRDRFMDVAGWGGLDPRPGNDLPENGFSGGDINRAEPAARDRPAVHAPGGRQRPGARLQCGAPDQRAAVQRVRARDGAGQPRRSRSHDRRRRAHPRAADDHDDPVDDVRATDDHDHGRQGEGPAGIHRRLVQPAVGDPRRRPGPRRGRGARVPEPQTPLRPRVIHVCTPARVRAGGQTGAGQTTGRSLAVKVDDRRRFRTAVPAGPGTPGRVSPSVARVSAIDRKREPARTRRNRSSAVPLRDSGPARA